MFFKNLNTSFKFNRVISCINYSYTRQILNWEKMLWTHVQRSNIQRKPNKKEKLWWQRIVFKALLQTAWEVQIQRNYFWFCFKLSWYLGYANQCYLHKRLIFLKPSWSKSGKTYECFEIVCEYVLIHLYKIIWNPFSRIFSVNIEIIMNNAECCNLFS